MLAIKSPTNNNKVFDFTVENAVIFSVKKLGESPVRQNLVPMQILSWPSVWYRSHLFAHTRKPQFANLRKPVECEWANHKSKNGLKCTDHLWQINHEPRPNNMFASECVLKFAYHSYCILNYYILWAGYPPINQWLWRVDIKVTDSAVQYPWWIALILSLLCRALTIYSEMPSATGIRKAQ